MLYGYDMVHRNRVKCGLLVKSKVWKAKDLELANVFRVRKKVGSMKLSTFNIRISRVTEVLPVASG